jgi:glutamine amidotransferase
MVGIIEYGAGNLFSLSCALDRLKIDYGFIREEEEMEKYERYIIPGVGHAGVAMDKLMNSGMVKPVLETQKPVLGICVGMQLLSRYSEEGDSPMLDIFPMDTRKFDSKHSIKIPHIGWNTVYQTRPNPLFDKISQNAYFYFVHSYFIELNPKFAIGLTEYGESFSSSIQFNNFWGVQFHPEKSGNDGEKLLKNFTEI